MSSMIPARLRQAQSSDVTQSDRRSRASSSALAVAWSGGLGGVVPQSAIELDLGAVGELIAAPQLPSTLSCVFERGVEVIQGDVVRSSSLSGPREMGHPPAYILVQPRLFG
jgi:hypothetical protein